MELRLVLTDQGASAHASYLESARAKAPVTPEMAGFCAAPSPEIVPPLTVSLNDGPEGPYIDQ